MIDQGIYFKEPSKQERIRELIKQIPSALSEETKAAVLRVINEAISHIRIGKMIEDDQVREAIKKMAEEIIDNQDAFLNLVEIRSHDEYTFAHSANVCLLLILNSVRRGFTRELIEQVAIGGLLHDIGKIRISEEILLKQSRLSQQEFEEVKQHPLTGYTILEKQGKDISPISKLITYQHHERNSGQGYPQGLRGDAISQYAAMAAVADVYDAMTTDRPYRKRFSPHDAMRLIISQVGSGFDREAVRAFIEDLSIYPVASLVMFNTGEIGLVVKVNRKSMIRPLVKILTDRDGQLLGEPMEVNLVEDESRYIISAVNEETFSV